MREYPFVLQTPGPMCTTDRRAAERSTTLNGWDEQGLRTSVIRVHDRRRHLAEVQLGVGDTALAFLVGADGKIERAWATIKPKDAHRVLASLDVD